MSGWRDDPVWGAFGEIKESRKKKRAARVEKSKADPSKWTVHSEHHWSCELLGHRLDYWPSTTRFRWKNRTYAGDVDGFILNREREATDGA